MTPTNEYNLTIDGIIEIEDGTDVKSFFDGLFDAVVAYVDEHRAMAGLSMSFAEYEDEGKGLKTGREFVQLQYFL